MVEDQWIFFHVVSAVQPWVENVAVGFFFFFFL